LNKPPDPLTFVQFQALVAEILLTDAANITPEAYFVTDLGVDSIRMVEILVRMEKLGLPLTPDLAWRIQTVGDAFRFYQEATDA